MSKLAQTSLACFGAFGTAWAILREFGVEVEAALVVLAFAAGMLFALRIRVIASQHPKKHPTGGSAPNP